MRDVPEDSLLDALDEAVWAGLVQEAGADRFRFAHLLVRATLLGELSATRRRRLHRRVGEALEKLRPDDVVALAHHFSQAGPDDDGMSRAVRYGLIAAEQALQARALGDAEARFRQVLELLGDRATLEAPARIAALCGLGEAQPDQGNAEFRTTLLEAGSPTWPRSCASPATTSAAWHCLTKPRALRGPAETPACWPGCSTGPATQRFAQFLQARVALAEGRFDDARRINDDALAQTQDLGEPDAVSWWGSSAMAIEMLPGGIAAVVDAVGDISGQYPDFPAWWVTHAVVLAMAGRAQEAREVLARHSPHASRAAPRPGAPGRGRHPSSRPGRPGR